MKVLSYKYLIGKQKSSISYNYYYKILFYDDLYKSSIKVNNRKVINKIVSTFVVHGGKNKYISWFKFFFLWLRNVIGFSIGLFKTKRFRLIKLFDSFSYIFYVYLDYFRFYLYPFFLQRYKIIKKHVFISSLGVVDQIHYMDYLTASGNIFYNFYDMFLKAKFFTTYLKERPLYLDSVNYSSSMVINFFFSNQIKNSDCFFSYFGFYSLDLNSFFLEKGNRFSYGLKIL